MCVHICIRIFLVYKTEALARRHRILSRLELFSLRTLAVSTIFVVINHWKSSFDFASSARKSHQDQRLCVPFKWNCFPCLPAHLNWWSFHFLNLLLLLRECWENQQFAVSRSCFNLAATYMAPWAELGPWNNDLTFRSLQHPARWRKQSLLLLTWTGQLRFLLRSTYSMCGNMCAFRHIKPCNPGFSSAPTGSLQIVISIFCR